MIQFPQSSRITESLLSECLMSYSGHSLWESYLSAEMQLMYSTALVDWAASFRYIVKWAFIFDMAANEGLRKLTI